MGVPGPEGHRQPPPLRQQRRRGRQRRQQRRQQGLFTGQIPLPAVLGHVPQVRLRTDGLRHILRFRLRRARQLLRVLHPPPGEQAPARGQDGLLRLLLHHRLHGAVHHLLNGDGPSGQGFPQHIRILPGNRRRPGSRLRHLFCSRLRRCLLWRFFRSVFRRRLLWRFCRFGFRRRFLRKFCRFGLRRRFLRRLCRFDLRRRLPEKLCPFDLRRSLRFGFRRGFLPHPGGLQQNLLKRNVRFPGLRRCFLKRLLLFGFCLLRSLRRFLWRLCLPGFRRRFFRRLCRCGFRFLRRLRLFGLRRFLRRFRLFGFRCRFRLAQQLLFQTPAVLRQNLLQGKLLVRGGHVGMGQGMIQIFDAVLFRHVSPSLFIPSAGGPPHTGEWPPPPRRSGNSASPAWECSPARRSAPAPDGPCPPPRCR